MVEWLKDWLGINRYILEWKIQWPSGDWYLGDTSDHKYIGHFTRRSANRLAREMNHAYGKDTHWVAPAS